MKKKLSTVIVFIALSLTLAGCTMIEVILGAAAAGLGGYIIGRDHK